MKDAGERNGTLWRPRRDFISSAAWVSFWAIVAGFFVILGKFLSPRKQPFARAEFVAGRPSAYANGEVSDRWLRDHQTWIVRDAGKLYAMWARCTHMNCTTIWDRNSLLFHCPCHRSQFDLNGKVRSGLARRPLERFRVRLNRRGEVVVDKSVVFETPEQWAGREAAIDV